MKKKRISSKIAIIIASAIVAISCTSCGATAHMTNEEAYRFGYDIGTVGRQIYDATR